MPKIYSRQDIIKFCEEASKDMKSFYNAPFIKYYGETKEKEPYTEIVAQWLLEHFKLFENISVVNREKSYRVKGHDGNTVRITNRKEEITAKQLFSFSSIDDPLYGIGKIIDYQVPLKNKQNDKGVGTIDLLSCNDEEKCVYILEYKKEDSTETMLRCVLEAYTYFCTVSKDKLLNDFEIDNSYTLKASPLVYHLGLQYKEYKDNNRDYLHELMKKLGSKPFFIKENFIEGKIQFMITE